MAGLATTDLSNLLRDAHLALKEGTDDHYGNPSLPRERDRQDWEQCVQCPNGKDGPDQDNERDEHDQSDDFDKIIHFQVPQFV